MTRRTSSSQSTITFPTTSPSPTHLPFRRISFPTTTSFQRLSAASVASFDSLPEEGGISNGQWSASHIAVSTTTETPTKGLVCRQRGRHNKAKYSSDARVEARQQKQRKIIQEFFDTEKTYVDGLDFVYHNFLSPLIASLETPEPLLDRTSLTMLFSNFIDIWNLHNAFFNALTRHLSPMLMTPESANSPHPPATQSPPPPPPPPLSPILLSHFPYLSLYTPFITAFPSILSTLASLTTPSTFSHPNPNYSKPFSDFLVKQESHPRCGKLKFRDWMLTIVQRCPRYLLLLKDLRRCMEPPVGEQGGGEREDNGDDNDGEEYDNLGRVLDLVSKITSSLNTSLQTHAQTLSLISLQRSTSNLPLSPPFRFVLPGRTLLKRGPLYQIERSEPPREREFLLFSDCLTWLAKKRTAGEETLGEWGWAKGGRITGSRYFMGSSESVFSESLDVRKKKDSISDDGGCSWAAVLYGTRNRSMSDAHLPLSLSPSPWRRKNDAADGSRSTPSSPHRARFSPSQVHVPAAKPRPKLKPKRHSMAGIIPGTSGNEGGVEERWVYKGRLDLVDLDVVVSSAWGVEQRRFEILSTEGSFALYAATEEERDDWVEGIRQAKAQWLVSLNVTHPNSTLTSSASTNHVRKSLQALPFPPSESAAPPAGKNGDASSTAVRRKQQQRGGAERVEDDRGGRITTTGRRGKVEHWVPAIWIPNERTKECMRCGQAFGWRRRRHHCRLCGRCVCARCSEKTFYVTDTHRSIEGGASKPARACNVCYETVFPVLSGPETSDVHGADSSDTQWGHSATRDTITTNFAAWISTPSLSILPGSRAAESSSSASSSSSSTPLTPLTPLMPLTPKALMGMDREHLFGDVNGRRRKKNANSTLQPRPLMSALEVFEDGGHHHRDHEEEEAFEPCSFSSSPKRAESTVKRRKRVSHPAIAMQPLNVTARTVPGVVDSSSSSSSSALGSGPGGERSTPTRRFSLVSGGPPFHRSCLSLVSLDGDNKGEEKEGDRGQYGEKSVAMGKLSELLKSSKATQHGF